MQGGPTPTQVRDNGSHRFDDRGRRQKDDVVCPRSCSCAVHAAPLPGNKALERGSVRHRTIAAPLAWRSGEHPRAAAKCAGRWCQAGQNNSIIHRRLVPCLGRLGQRPSRPHRHDRRVIVPLKRVVVEEAEEELANAVCVAGAAPAGGGAAGQHRRVGVKVRVPPVDHPRAASVLVHDDGHVGGASGARVGGRRGGGGGATPPRSRADPPARPPVRALGGTARLARGGSGGRRAAAARKRTS